MFLLPQARARPARLALAAVHRTPAEEEEEEEQPERPARAVVVAVAVAVAVCRVRLRELSLRCFADRARHRFCCGLWAE